MKENLRCLPPNGPTGPETAKVFPSAPIKLGGKTLLCHKVVQTWVGIGSEWSQAFHEADPLGSMSNEGRLVGGPWSEGHRHFCSGPFSG